MELWLVQLDLSPLSEELYQRALQLVDAASRARVQRFHRRQDAWRTLIGRLLPRVLLRERGVPVAAISFGALDAGKPYVSPGVLDPPLAFNITHDANAVALAFCAGSPAHAPAYRLGVDVMRVYLPPRDTPDSFIGSFVDQLAPLERTQLGLDPAPASPGPSAGNTSGSASSDSTVDEQARLKSFYAIWVLKEAYTKALGLGLGFDFARLAYDASRARLLVDGAPARGWQLVHFKFRVARGAADVSGGGGGAPAGANVGAGVDAGEEYVGALARFVGGDAETVVRAEAADGDPAWLTRLAAAPFVERAEGLLLG